MTFGKEGAEQARVFKPETCQEILDIFKSHGHLELDSARMYGGGSSEEMLRDLGAEKQGFKIATKVSKCTAPTTSTSQRANELMS